MPSSAATIGDRMVERGEIGEPRRFTFACRIAQMVVEAAVRGFPRRFVGLPQPVAEPFAHQWMGVERFGIGRINRRQQPRLAQPRDGAPPLVFAQINDRVGQSANRRLGAQRPEAIAARRAVEQADAMEDGEQGRLPGEPFFLVGLHHAPRVTVERIVGVGEQAADMIAPAHVAVLRFFEIAREQGQRERMTAEVAGRNAQICVRARDAVVAQQFGAGLVRQVLDAFDRRRSPAQRTMSATSARLVSTMSPELEAGGAAAKRRSSAAALGP